MAASMKLSALPAQVVPVYGNGQNYRSHQRRPFVSPSVNLNPCQPRRCLISQASAAADTAGTSQEVDQAIQLLIQAANDANVPSVQVFQALRTLDKAKLPTEGWPGVIGGSASPGRRWRLVFTTGTKQVQEALKGVNQGGGKYFPLTAVQRWDAVQGQIENGIFLGHVAALTFQGPYAMTGKKLSFDFDTLSLRLGPAKFDIPLKQKIEKYEASPKDPFFIFFFVNENIICARGRSGGIAFWARTSPKWELENGIV